MAARVALGEAGQRVRPSWNENGAGPITTLQLVYSFTRQPIQSGRYESPHSLSDPSELISVFHRLPGLPWAEQGSVSAPVGISMAQELTKSTDRPADRPTDRPTDRLGDWPMHAARCVRAMNTEYEVASLCAEFLDRLQACMDLGGECLAR